MPALGLDRAAEVQSSEAVRSRQPAEADRIDVRRGETVATSARLPGKPDRPRGFPPARGSADTLSTADAADTAEPFG